MTWTLLHEDDFDDKALENPDVGNNVTFPEKKSLINLSDNRKPKNNQPGKAFKIRPLTSRRARRHTSSEDVK